MSGQASRGAESAWVEQIVIKPSYDHRFDPEKWSRGCGTMTIEFILQGPLGAVTASIFTGWMHEPLIERPTGYGGMPKGPWGSPVRAKGKLGPDCISRYYYEGASAGSISCHVAEPPAGKEWFSAAAGCTLIEGGTCYGDTGYMVGDTFLDHLGRGGSEAAFAFLREIHDDWCAPDPEAVTSPTQDGS